MFEFIEERLLTMLGNCDCEQCTHVFDMSTAEIKEAEARIKELEDDSDRLNQLVDNLSTDCANIKMENNDLKKLSIDKFEEMCNDLNEKCDNSNCENCPVEYLFCSGQTFTLINKFKEHVLKG